MNDDAIIQYLRNEVNRLNNVIAERDWTIGEMAKKEEQLGSRLKEVEARLREVEDWNDNYN